MAKATDEKKSTRVDDDELVAMATINKCIVTELEKLEPDAREHVKQWVFNRHFAGCAANSRSPSES